MRTIAQTHSAIPQTGPSFKRRFTLIASRAFNVIGLCFSVWRERQHLAELDERMLKDIGLSHHEARQEFHRDFYDLPTRRLI